MKWEYLRVQIQGNAIVPRTVHVAANDGSMHEWKKLPGDRDYSSVVGRLLTKLGDDDWELAGVTQFGETSSQAVLFFKRPKP
ncbi:MAG: hypothetical protein AB1817_02065 [Chloroflexota bacterium]